MMLIKLSQMSTQLLQEIPIHVPCGWILPKFEETSEESPAWKSSWRRMEIKVCCFHWNWNLAPLGFVDLITLNLWIPFLHLRTKLPMLKVTLQVDPRLPHCKFLDHLPHPLPLPHHPTCSHCWLAPRLVSFPFAPWQSSAPWHFSAIWYFLLHGNMATFLRIVPLYRIQGNYLFPFYSVQGVSYTIQEKSLHYSPVSRV